jgi:hypothetical protein
LLQVASNLQATDGGGIRGIYRKWLFEPAPRHFVANQCRPLRRYLGQLGLSFETVDALTEPVITTSLSPEMVDRVIDHLALRAQTDGRSFSATEGAS